MTILTKKEQEKRISRSLGQSALPPRSASRNSSKDFGLVLRAPVVIFNEWSLGSTISVTSRQDVILPAKQSACLKLGHVHH